MVSVVDADGIVTGHSQGGGPFVVIALAGMFGQLHMGGAVDGNSFVWTDLLIRTSATTTIISTINKMYASFFTIIPT